MPEVYRRSPCVVAANAFGSGRLHGALHERYNISRDETATP